LKQGEIKSLTGLRGSAASLVVAYHFGLAFGFDSLPQPVVIMLRHGYLAVDMFFVLSGFVVAMTYGPWFADNSVSAPYRLFIIRRIGRLYPLYFVGLLAGCLVLIIMPIFRARFTAVEILNHPTLAVLTNLLMIQNWGLSGSINPPAWSLSTEWAAYLAFPLLYIKAFNRRHARFLLATAAFSVLVYCYVHPASGYTLIPLLRCLGGFIIGVSTYTIWPHVRHIVAMPVACPLVSVVIIAVATLRVTDTLFIPLFPALILTLAEGNGPVQTILSSRVPYALGILSYSIYMLHDILIGSAVYFIIEALTPSFYYCLAIGLFVATVLFAAVTHRFIEITGRQAIRRLESFVLVHQPPVITPR
jgi:peptidoglycan/LPS O-acetylase OafA/YrhL